jgi:hypothetical protein
MARGLVGEKVWFISMDTLNIERRHLVAAVMRRAEVQSGTPVVPRRNALPQANRQNRQNRQQSLSIPKRGVSTHCCPWSYAKLSLLPFVFAVRGCSTTERTKTIRMFLITGTHCSSAFWQLSQLALPFLKEPVGVRRMMEEGNGSLD